MCKRFDDLPRTAPAALEIISTRRHGSGARCTSKFFTWAPSAMSVRTRATDELVKRVSAGTVDLGLQELYFQFARYMLISSSRSDGLPANLQGIWAAGIDNPWGSKYTINVNTEMNHWLAEPAGLGKTALPLINLIDMVRMPDSGTGTQVARTYYGARGFVICHNTDSSREMPTRSTAYLSAAYGTLRRR